MFRLRLRGSESEISTKLCFSISFTRHSLKSCVISPSSASCYLFKVKLMGLGGWKYSTSLRVRNPAFLWSENGLCRGVGRWFSTALETLRVYSVSRNLVHIMNYAFYCQCSTALPDSLTHRTLYVHHISPTCHILLFSNATRMWEENMASYRSVLRAVEYHRPIPRRRPFSLQRNAGLQTRSEVVYFHPTMSKTHFLACTYN